MNIFYIVMNVSMDYSPYFNCCISHAHLPSNLLDTVIIPIIKDKKADITGINHYRPYCLILYNVKHFWDNVTMERSVKYLAQSILVSSLSIQQTSVFLHLNKQLNITSLFQTSVYLAVWDASKAFDRINHFIGKK